jgi:DNA-binding beta-propeller fold protein YncE
VSKVQSATNSETARYRSGGTEPSRVAVDYRGDVWVANRAFEGRSTVRKIAGSRERCVDRDGNGTLETSSGPDDVLPPGQDECILTTVPVGEPGDVARALAIDGDRGLDGAHGGNLWVGLHEGQQVVQLDGRTGTPLQRVSTPGFHPYTAAFDPWGTLWMISKDGRIGRIDRQGDSPEFQRIDVPFPCYQLYEFTLDDTGRLVLTGFNCNQVLTYTPRTEGWATVDTPPSVRGAVVRQGQAWVAHTGGRVSRLSLDPLQLLETYSLSSGDMRPLESVGIAATSSGSVWVASTQGGPDRDGLVTRLDGSDGSVTAQIPVGRAPHTHGDLSGERLGGAFVPEASRSHVFEGCRFGGLTEWLRLHLQFLPGTAGEVAVAVRHAERRDSLAEQDFVALGRVPDTAPPFELDLPPGGVVEVRLTLRTEARRGAPRVGRVGLEWNCPGPS